jgi:hypothetical protein
MKKAITILAVLIVLVSAVFAAETHKLKIKATQATIAPAFQMYVKSVAQAAGASADSTIVTNSSAEKFDAHDGDTMARGGLNPESDIAATINFEVTNTVTVAVKLGNDAKTTQNYLLTFSDGIFNVNKNGASQYNNGTEQDPDMKNYTVGPESKSAAAGEDSSAENGFTTAPSTNTATVDFNGKTCTTGHEIATCAYAYAAHTDVDPGTYYADIVLTIATTN